MILLERNRNIRIEINMQQSFFLISHVIDRSMRMVHYHAMLKSDSDMKSRCWAIFHGIPWMFLWWCLSFHGILVIRFSSHLYNSIVSFIKETFWILWLYFYAEYLQIGNFRQNKIGHSLNWFGFKILESFEFKSHVNLE